MMDCWKRGIEKGEREEEAFSSSQTGLPEGKIDPLRSQRLSIKQRDSGAFEPDEKNKLGKL